MSRRLGNIVRGAGIAAALAFVPVAVGTPALAQGMPNMGDAAAAMACLQEMTEGVVLTDDIVVHFIETYPAIQEGLASTAESQAAVADMAAGAPPTYICDIEPTAQMDGFVTPYGYDGFMEWSSIFATMMIAMMFSGMDAETAVMMQGMLGVSSTPENVAALAPHQDELMAAMESAIPE